MSRTLVRLILISLDSLRCFLTLDGRSTEDEMTCYMHQVPGRLRFRARSFKRDPIRLIRAACGLKTFAGVSRVEINRTTGSVTVRYDARLICPSFVINALSLDAGLSHTLVGFPVRRRHSFLG